ncbi:hypothetical protein [Spiroplasma endosymbiont of Polydrusus formosus]|uniref:hypothetical protein n=1 Tax=Spiroplasma endosymbiont of Polydrusus formosus TaxID=3139326 RepID=UPI0035B56B77
MLIKNNKPTLNKSMTVSSLAIPISNDELIQISNVKPKIKYWIWIMEIIGVLLLTSGVEAIGYEIYRRTTYYNLINKAFVGNKNNK